MIITDLQITKLKGAFNTLLDLAENSQIEAYQREEYYFIGSGIESIIREIEQGSVVKGQGEAETP